MLKNKEPSPSSSQSRCAAATPAAATPPSSMLAMPAALAVCAAPLPLSQSSAASLAAAAAAAAAGREPTPAEEQRYQELFHLLADKRQGSELPGVSLRLLELLRQLGPDAPNGTADADAPPSMEQQAFCVAYRSPWHAYVCVWRMHMARVSDLICI
jgi:hypothetical protein